jgi:hypothetical protein
MAECWIVNSSPLICLDRIGLLDILGRLGREVVISPREDAPPALASSPMAHSYEPRNWPDRFFQRASRGAQPELEPEIPATAPAPTVQPAG